ncbi:Ig-like domain-containing protein [Paludisphaera mucosa]|uniref:Ig-like domain-containing protein n=1 Tax=Paludisphaera mucosa TaxID=3030827 RepID=A0ABT6F5Z6_9BACT|nr:Ig-like domain-containing protein [Paludisphaera mucosa]
MLSFDGALDAASAQNPAKYRVADGGGRVVPIARAVYDPTTYAVTLTPSQRLDLHRTYTLAVDGRLPQGVAGASGIALDGSGRGEPGTDFVASITWRALAAPGDSPAMVFIDGTPHATTATFNNQP